MAKTKTNYYIDNKEFFLEMAEYRKEYLLSLENNEPKPRISESIGSKFLKIAYKLSNKGNFVGYTFKDEMVGNAIENMLKYAHNFNPDKTNNAFAYFTQIAWYAFVRRIIIEKKMYTTKAKMVQNMVINDFVLDDRQEHDLNSEYQNSYVDYLMDYYDYNIENEPKKEVKPKKEIITALTEAMNNE